MLYTMLNLAVGSILPPGQGVGDLVLTLNVGQGNALFPNAGTGSDTSFPIVVWASSVYASPALDPDAEIELVTARAGDVLTVSRAAEKIGNGTATPYAHNTVGVTYSVALVMTEAQIIKMASDQGSIAGTDTGTANAYVVSITNYPPSLSNGTRLLFTAAHANTGGACTINVNGLGAVSILTSQGLNPSAGDISTTAITELRYNGTNFVLKTFLQPFVSVSYQQPNGTNGGEVASTNTWVKYPLNTLVQDTAGIASLTSNQITLPAGTYKVRGNFQIYNFSYVGMFRLYNTTNSAVIAYSQNVNCDGASQVGVAIEEQEFTLSASSVLEVDYIAESKNNSYDLGVSTGADGITTGTVERYGNITFTKVA